MGKRVILTLMEGSFEQGFPAILRISENGAPAETGIQIPGKLPPAPDVVELFKNWQSAYRQVVRLNSRIKAKPAQVTNVSCRHLSDNLTLRLNDWLNSGSREWQKIRDGLQRFLSDTDEIQLIIQTSDIRLRQLPWHLWDFFEHYPKAEVAMSTPEYQPLGRSLANKLGSQVRILAILGNSQGIDIEKDRVFLEQLSNQAQTKFLVEPQPEELNDQLWEHGWDILFFAGHSCSKEKGLLQLNQTDSLTLDQLRYALKKAIKRGLKLAIFNSCDGLGLAQQLFDLHIGQVIVMREPVPDAVAQEFLRHFLAAFSSGQSLYASVREARERLQKLESKFPCASWLPVLCQNAAEAAMTWPEWCSQNGLNYTTGRANQQNRQILPSRSGFQKVLVASVVVTALVMGGRWLGMLQALELQGYDQLMRWRPSERQDRRLLVVTITEEDFQLPEQQQRKGSLSDLALARLLEQLGQFKPRAIGLDIYHDFPVKRNPKDLGNRLRHNHGFFAICKVNKPSTSPPPEIPTERQGFSDFVVDPDGILRRHLLAMNPSTTSPCTTSYALSAQLAFHYLEAEGIFAKYTDKKDLQVGRVVFKRLRSHMGGYQQVDDRGYQILLNYRSYGSPLEVAETVTLRDVLTAKVKPEAVKNRIILIGVTAPSARDPFFTPYSAGQGFYEEMPGVIVHAQMVSQILSAVKGERSLLWVWPFWGEVLWVWGWSVVGGVLAWRFWSIRLLLLTSGAALGVLCGLCFGLIIQGGWVPLVPSALALVLTGGSIVASTTYQTQRQQHTSIALSHE